MQPLHHIILRCLYEATRSNLQIEKEIDFIYDIIDDDLSSGQFDFIDNLLKDAIVDKLHIHFSLALLTATLPVKSKLINRADFFSRVKEHCISIGKHKQLLAGLE